MSRPAAPRKRRNPPPTDPRTSPAAGPGPDARPRSATSRTAGSGGRARPSARSVALDALLRIEHEGAYANLVLPALLERSGLESSDRRFATDLVYGTTRMRRACAAVYERYVMSTPEPAVSTLLGLGTYQLLFGGVAPHAAVGETVGLAPPRARGFANAILRKVAGAAAQHGDGLWASDAERLSYPDWIVSRVVAEVGADDGIAALERMNRPAPVSTRADGYVQDLASQWVAELVDAQPGDRVLDVCAAPGGKATAIGVGGAFVVAADLQPHRVALILQNAASTAADVVALAADGTAPPFVAGSFDRILLDAPCSGLGALRRRPDARWRIQPSDIDDLARLQVRLLAAAAPLLRPGGTLMYSVCTITAAESIDHPTPEGLTVDASPLPAPWRPFGSGHRLLPHDADTDGMVVVRYHKR